MYKLKTRLNNNSVENFLNLIEDIVRKRDCFSILKLMKKITGKKPKMWWSSIVGFWVYKYTYTSGHCWEWMITWFSPRKRALTIYIMPWYQDYSKFLEKLWKHKTWKSCLYLKSLEDINLNILEALISSWVNYMKNNYETDL